MSNRQMNKHLFVFVFIKQTIHAEECDDRHRKDNGEDEKHLKLGIDINSVYLRVRMGAT